MFEKNLKLAYLLDFYGDILDEHTKAVMKAYYDDDLSLAEIAEGLGISRQGVRHIVKKGGEQLLFLEERLGLARQGECLAEAAARLSELICRPDLKELDGYKDIACDIRFAINAMLDKNMGRTNDHT